MRLPLLLAIALVPEISACPAQPPAAATSPAATTNLSVESRLVNIPVVVRDNKGALVDNLTRTDFSLQADGKPQTIRYFDLDRDLPLSLGLLVDTSQSQRSVIDEERSASSTFLDTMLTGRQDAAFLAQFARQVELLQETTSSRAKLQAALKELDTPNPDALADSRDQDSGSPDSGSERRSRGGTALYDAVFLASDELMSRQKGRKALVVLTDGNDRGSKERLTDAIEAAQRADTIVYAIYFKGEQPREERNNGVGRGGGFPRAGGGYPGGRGGNGGNREPDQRPDGKKVLERMAHETGGRLFEVTKKQPVSDIYTEIGRELRAQYRLGYVADKDAASDGYHKIELAFTSPDRKKYSIQTREGYYAGK